MTVFLIEFTVALAPSPDWLLKQVIALGRKQIRLFFTIYVRVCLHQTICSQAGSLFFPYYLKP